MSPPSNRSASTHSPAQDWSYRVPSPPHVLVPPAPFHLGRIQEFHDGGDSQFNFKYSGFTNTEFLKTIGYDHMTMSNPLFTWKYEDRRTAQAVLPFLYLGPVTAANDDSFLLENGITMVLAVRNTKSARMKLLESKIAGKIGIESHAIDVTGNQELIAAFPKGIEMINAHISAMNNKQSAQTAQGSLSSTDNPASLPGKVLVYCETGNDRSSLLVTAYIMAMFSTNLIKAIQSVQARRFAVVYDDHSRNILQAFDSILQAKRDVIQANLKTTTPFSHNEVGLARNPNIMNGLVIKTKKRAFNDFDAEDEDVIMGDNEQDTTYKDLSLRRGSAPFQDRPDL